MHWIDPDGLPQWRGTVSRFLINPHGELDGLILGSRRRRQVHFPPHLSGQVARHIAVGDKISVSGVKPRGADMLVAVALSGPDGKTILDEGPRHDRDKHHKPHREHREMEASGEVVLHLFGARGELRGALLADGTALLMPPDTAARFSEYLTPGTHVQAWGHGVRNRHGCALEVDAIAELVDVAS
ncbi:hypothetical protein CAL12_03610 [Bordetella genomosp. 8]|uniref:Uncharacterized protein n=1 Tax=Bordetella genomosp. 8 TaxID=1416806 RepID=A0A1W6YG52_9BORD|nr:hypothetical protein [Bordetella genomosp. 8]ARP79999.1 hypothetical protein CAL12_03610 [Bordetella genomosp. 8]